MTNNHLFLPAEWYPQSAIQLTWPHAQTDWVEMLDEVYACFINLAREISLRQPLLIVTPELQAVQQQLTQEGVSLANIRFFEANTNDTWARDHGAITVIENNQPRIVDFKFNGWGLKFAAHHDNLITSALYQAGILKGEYQNELNFVLEGGGIESDGEGTLLTTSECLLSPNRNGAWSKAQIEDYLKAKFNLQRILWLDHGYLAGDDTDSHIDTLARLCPNDTITYVQCLDTEDEHYSALQAMEAQLQSFRTLDDKPYRLIPLPMTEMTVDEEGDRTPGTYANFLIMNEAVLYPTYQQPDNDLKAKEALQQAFPGYEIIGIDCSALIKQHGSLHCVTMQFPQGVI